MRQLSNAEAASSPAPAGTAIAVARRALGTICMADAVVNDIHVVFPANAAKEQLGALAAELLSRRDVILDAWRAYGTVVPDARNIAASLSRAQFNDHIPAVLDSLSRTLQAWPEVPGVMAEHLEADKVADHGVQRWQQGYSFL